MTEEEWQDCEEPADMINYIEPYASVTAIGQQRGELLLIACCRHVWNLLYDDRSRTALVGYEQFLQGRLYPGFNTDRMGAISAARETRDESDKNYATRAIASIFAKPGFRFANCLSTFANLQLAGMRKVDICHLIREIFSPFNSVNLHSEWFNEDVIRLADSAYENRLSARMCDVCNGAGGFLVPPEWKPPRSNICTRCMGYGTLNDHALDNELLSILGDALEDAGCPAYFKDTPNPLLTHLRNREKHVRGCWALDMIRRQ